jgi:hypothetical protein
VTANPLSGHTPRRTSDVLKIPVLRTGELL